MGATLNADGRNVQASGKRLKTLLRPYRIYGMNYRARIKPCIRGLRMTVYDILDYLASGMTPEQIVDDFPELEIDDIRACLAFAADRERRLFTGNP
jgi:uncharacterized protein (DUF433 family)